MEANRRDFLKGAGLLAAAACGGGAAAAVPKTGAPVAAKAGAADYATDVLVVGGGPAGVCAAIAAARNGARVLVVEQSGMLGGMATQGLVGPFMTCYDKSGETMIIRGLFEEIVERLVARGGALHPRGVFGNGPYSAWIPKGHDHVTPFDPEALKVLLDEMCAEAGVKVLFHTTFVEPVLDGRRAAGARLFGKGGFRRVSAKIVVDATGDGDYAYRAGVPCTLGDGNGRLMPATMFFHICNIDSDRLIADIEANRHTFHKKDGVSYRGFHWYVTKAIAAGEWDLPRRCLNMYRGVGPDVWLVNNGRIPGVDATDSESLSRAEVEGGLRACRADEHGQHRGHPRDAPRGGRGDAARGGRSERRGAEGQHPPRRELGGRARREGQPDGVVLPHDQCELVRRLLPLPRGEGRGEPAPRGALPLGRAGGRRRGARDAALHGDGPGGRHGCGARAPRRRHAARARRV